MTYVLLNSDNTVNYIGESLDGIDLTDVNVIKCPERTIESLLDDVPPMFAVWDDVKKVVRDVRDHPELLIDVRNPSERVRHNRDIKLSTLDDIVKNPLRYEVLTDEQKTKLATYRQALLDVPQQDGFPSRIDWPHLPDFITRS